MRREREAMGLPPLPTSATNSAVGSSSAAMTVSETAVTAEREPGVPEAAEEEEADFREGGALGGEEDKLMWLAWPFQVRNL